MPLILAVEPDHRQAAKVKALARRTLQAELIAVDTASHALEVLATRVPDLILTSTLLSPRDEAILTARLRELDAAGLQVQTLVIPVLGTASRGSRRHDSSGLFSRLRRPRAPDGQVDGCEPEVFAGQIEEYLDRATSDRADVAERDKPVYPEFTPAPTPSEQQLEPVWDGRTHLSLVDRKLEPAEREISLVPAYEKPSPEEEPLSHAAESILENPAPVAEPPEVQPDPGEALLATPVSTEESESLFDKSESVRLARDPKPDFSYSVIASTEREQIEPESLTLVRDVDATEEAPGIGLEPEASGSVILAEGSSADCEEVSAAFEAPVPPTESVVLHTEAVIYASERVSAWEIEDTTTSREATYEHWEQLDVTGEDIEPATEVAVDNADSAIEEDDQVVVVLPLDLSSFADDLDTAWRTEPESETPVAQVDIDRGDATLVAFTTATTEADATDVSEEPIIDVVADSSDTWQTDSQETSLLTDSSPVEALSLDEVPTLQRTVTAEPTEAPLEPVQAATELDRGDQMEAASVEPADPGAPAEPRLSALPEFEDRPVESPTVEEAPEVTMAAWLESEPELPPMPAAVQIVEEPVESVTTQLTPAADNPVAPATIASATTPLAVVEMLAAIRRDIDELRQDRVTPAVPVESSDADIAHLSTAHVDPDDGPVESESVSADESTGTARGPLVMTAPSTPKAIRVSASTQNKKKRKKKHKNPPPLQDEWSFFDPDQCGFAALVAKLEEITEEEAAAQRTD